MKNNSHTGNIQVGDYLEVIEINEEYWGCGYKIGNQYCGLLNRINNFYSYVEGDLVFESEYKLIGRLKIKKIKSKI